MQRLKPRSPKLVRNHRLARGLVAAYPLFEGAGNYAADLGPKQNKASLTAVSAVASPFGSALSFNGSTSTLQSATTFPVLDSGDFTIAVLFCPTSIPGIYVALFDNAGRDPSAFFNAGGGAATWYLAYGSQATDSVGSITISANKWYRFVWTHAGSLNTVYINGVVSGTSSAAVITPVAAVVQIGLNPSAGGQKFTGYVAECRTYNRALTAAEVAQDYFDPFAIYRRSVYRVGVVGGATSFAFPTAAWHWNGQAPSQAFTNAAAQKSWVWHPQAPTQAFAVAPAQKAWRWNAQAPGLNLTPAIPQKAWAWAGNAPVLGQAISAARKAWLWAAQSPNVTGGNIITNFTVKMLGPIWKRRRSRPPL